MLCCSRCARLPRSAQNVPLVRVPLHRISCLLISRFSRIDSAPHGATNRPCHVLRGILAFIPPGTHSRCGHGLPRIDAEIERTNAELDAHIAQSTASAEQSADLLALLGQVKAKKVPLPAQAEAQIRKIADVARERTALNSRRQQTSSMPSRQQFVGSDKLSSDSDDFDLWLYMATDVPTSLRTLLLSALNSYHHGMPTDSHGQFSGAGTSGNWGDDAPDQRASDAAAAAMGLEAQAISTDDSLGRYS